MERKRIRIGAEELPWWRKPMTLDDFVIMTDGNEFLARHKAWKGTIFIGPYEAKDDLSVVLVRYMKESKKHPFKQKEIKGFKTCVKVLDSSFKEI